MSHLFLLKTFQFCLVQCHVPPATVSVKIKVKYSFQWLECGRIRFNGNKQNLVQHAENSERHREQICMYMLYWLPQKRWKLKLRHVLLILFSHFLVPIYHTSTQLTVLFPSYIMNKRKNSNLKNKQSHPAVKMVDAQGILRRFLLSLQKNFFFLHFVQCVILLITHASISMYYIDSYL